MIIGPPRGCAMSPINSPFQPTFLASAPSRSMKRTSRGVPQLRSRDSRMTCQAGPVIGSAHRPGEAAVGIGADRHAPGRETASLAGEQFLGRRGRRIRIGERRQRLWIERAGRRRIERVGVLRGQRRERRLAPDAGERPATSRSRASKQGCSTLAFASQLSATDVAPAGLAFARYATARARRRYAAAIRSLCPVANRSRSSPSSCQQPPFGRRMRLDAAVVQNVADAKAARGERARHQETAVAIERLALRAHQADACLCCGSAPVGDEPSRPA